MPPHVVEPTIPVSIERTILKCLEKEPERRYLSIAELETALAAPLSERTVIAAPWPAAQSKAQSAAAPKPSASVARPALPPPVRSKNSAPILWVLVGVGLTFVVLGGLRAGAIQKAAKQIVFNEKFKAPVPPDFAYEIPQALPTAGSDFRCGTRRHRRSCARANQSRSRNEISNSKNRGSSNEAARRSRRLPAHGDRPGSKAR